MRPPSLEAVHLRDFLVREQVWERYDRGFRNLPPLTLGLVGACLIWHLATGVADQNLWGVRSLEVLVRWGARSAPEVEAGELHRLIQAVFLHGDWLHWSLNMLALYGLGRLCEAIWGGTRVFSIFLLSGLGGSALSQLLGAEASVGASGAIFGLMGAGVSFGLLQARSLPLRLRRVLGRGLLPWVLLNVAIGALIPQIDNWGHIGGLLTGLVLGAFVKDRLVPGRQRQDGPARFLAVMCLLAVLGAWLRTLFSL